MQKILTTLLAWLAAAPALAVSADLLVYKVWEEGAEPYISRILVTPDHLRMDEGDDEGDFTLLDRRAGVVYNVSREDRSVLVMAPGEAPASLPSAVRLEVRDDPDPEAPRVGGVQPHRVELLADGESCGTLTVLPGRMPAALEGLRELRRVLARVQAASLAAAPPGVTGPCDRATAIQAPTWSLDHGLPLSERAPGRTQLLLDHEADSQVPDRLFRLPKDYRRIHLPTLTAGPGAPD